MWRVATEWRVLCLLLCCVLPSSSHKWTAAEIKALHMGNLKLSGRHLLGATLEDTMAGLRDCGVDKTAPCPYLTSPYSATACKNIIYAAGSSECTLSSCAASECFALSRRWLRVRSQVRHNQQTAARGASTALHLRVFSTLLSPLSSPLSSSLLLSPLSSLLLSSANSSTLPISILHLLVPSCGCACACCVGECHSLAS